MTAFEAEALQAVCSLTCHMPPVQTMQKSVETGSRDNCMQRASEGLRAAAIVLDDGQLAVRFFAPDSSNRKPQPEAAA